MVEATDSSAGQESVQPAPTNTPPAGTTAPPEQGTGEFLAPPEREAYQPLSLLALFGFIPAVFYALMILGGALVALKSRSPWLLPNWTFIIPVATLLICWIARSQIQSSEGVLAGLSLTSWGIGLSLFFSLTYAAYSGATYFAIREQARSYAQKWMSQIQEGQIERAFNMMLPPGDRLPESEQLRAALEQVHNRPDPKGGPGHFTSFAQMELIRLLQDGGLNTEIQFQGVAAWEYENNGYRVRLRYQITTPLLSFEAVVTVRSVAPLKGQSGARAWSVIPGPENTDMLKETIVFSPSAEVLREQIGVVGKVGQDWVNGFENDSAQHLRSYLGTLPPTERQRVLTTMQQSEILGPATGLAPLAGSLSREMWKGLKAFQKGDWIQLAPAFWAEDEATKKKITRAAKNLCNLKPGEMMMMFQPSTFPLIKKNGENDLQLLYDMRLAYRQDDMMRPYILEGFLVLETQTPDSTREDAWRVKGLELTSVHKAQAPTPPRPR